jgi:5-(carboxyamino)imidazole ribonucleotide synthase
MRVGIIGAGQLARMLEESASTLGIATTVLATSSDEAAVETAGDVVLGSADDLEALHTLAGSCDVVTFDHELVDLNLIASLEDAGIDVFPSSSALLFSVDKAAMRERLHHAGLPVPRYSIVPAGVGVDFAAIGESWGWPLVIKTASGGYDGKGVFLVNTVEEAHRVEHELRDAKRTMVVEEHVNIVKEIAAMVVRNSAGEICSYPAVETVQQDGINREVIAPAEIDPDLLSAANAIAVRIAELIGVVGVLAVELFTTNDGLMINELALRPHNSGHWTQDGAVTSQFENHLRAVLGLPLGDTSLRDPFVCSVNILGGNDVASFDPLLAEALGVNAKVHLYGKAPRPGRKLGHVTATGSDRTEVRNRAWAAAVALKTPAPPTI